MYSTAEPSDHVHDPSTVESLQPIHASFRYWPKLLRRNWFSSAEFIDVRSPPRPSAACLAAVQPGPFVVVYKLLPLINFGAAPCTEKYKPSVAVPVELVDHAKKAVPFWSEVTHASGNASDGIELTMYSSESGEPSTAENSLAYTLFELAESELQDTNILLPPR